MADQPDPLLDNPTETHDITRSPSLSPTPAISSCPSPDRTFSTVSSSVSNFSGDAKSSSSGSSRRRGYMRPQGATFAESAKNRESVMSLGSIAHLQYYFARTGLLDGKGGQARTKKKGEELEIPKLMLTQQAEFSGDFTESPIDEGGDATTVDWDEDGHEPVMLPPTVSTYSIRTHYIPPPPDLDSLRRDLQKALDKARQVLTVTKDELAAQSRVAMKRRESRADIIPHLDEEAMAERPPSRSQPMGWYEVEGMHILDLITLAIRAARVYYTSHENPERLATIKSERKIREELLSVLEVLKRWASRYFAGGLRDEERAAILEWISGIGDMLGEEQRLEDIEKKRRESWSWTSGDWEGKESEREQSFMQSLASKDVEPLPAWDSVDSNPCPTPLLSRLRDGRDLVRFHNEAVRLSKRPFGQIKSFHEDIGKPYRMADNLRYWAKAAEIRWEMKLEVDVMGVVNGDSDEAWKKFDRALLLWCQGVREELLRDWKGEDDSAHPRLPAVTLEANGADMN